MKKDRVYNLLILIAIALILFTPVGFHLKVFVNRIISFNPTQVKESERQVLRSFDWELQDRQSKRLNLNKSEGKVIFINIWASWCPPCVAEMPSLQELYNDYQNKVEFYFIARDSQAKIEGFMAKHGYDFPVYYELSKAPLSLQTNSLPTTYVIDQSGFLVVNETGAAKWNSDTTRGMIDQLIDSGTKNLALEKEVKINEE